MHYKHNSYTQNYCVPTKCQTSSRGKKSLFLEERENKVKNIHTVSGRVSIRREKIKQKTGNAEVQKDFCVTRASGEWDSEAN